jgi:hypothetical protein
MDYYSAKLDASLIVPLQWYNSISCVDGKVTGYWFSQDICGRKVLKSQVICELSHIVAISKSTNLIVLDNCFVTSCYGVMCEVSQVAGIITVKIKEGDVI